MTTPTILSIPRIPRLVDDEDAMQQLRDGLGNALSTFSVPEIDKAYEAYEARGPAEFDPPGIAAWDEEVTNAAIAEVAPAVAAMLNAAIEKRLPWSSGDR